MNPIRALVSPDTPNDLNINFVNSNSKPAHPNIKKNKNGSIFLAIIARITPNIMRVMLNGNILPLFHLS